MSVESTRAVMTSYLQILADRGPYAQYFADDIVLTLEGTDQRVDGRDPVEQFVRYFHEQAFDARPEVKNTLVADGQAAAEIDFVGTHVGEFAGVPASNRTVRVPYAVLYDLREDKITALRLYMPVDLLMQQIGATPAGGQAGA